MPLGSPTTPDFFLTGELRLAVNPTCFEKQLLPYVCSFGLFLHLGAVTCRFIHFPERRTMISSNKKLLISHRTQKKTIAALLGAPLLEHVTACVIIELSRQILRWTYNSECYFLLIEHKTQGLLACNFFTRSAFPSPAWIRGI